MPTLKLHHLITEDDIGLKISDILLKRIPFLKDYYIHINEENRLFLQKSEYNDIKLPMGGDIINFTIQLISEFRYSKRVIRENTFYNFTLKNGLYITRAEGIGELIRQVMNIANRKISEKLSYRKEIIIKEPNELSEEQLNNVINNINRIFFDLEEFTNDHHINFF